MRFSEVNVPKMIRKRKNFAEYRILGNTNMEGMGGKSVFWKQWKEMAKK